MQFAVILFFYAETKNEVTLSAHQIFSEFFTVELLTELCRQLVLNYFPLHEDELRCWLTDPENFSEFGYLKKFFDIKSAFMQFSAKLIVRGSSQKFSALTY